MFLCPQQSLTLPLQCRVLPLVIFAQYPCTASCAFALSRVPWSHYGTAPSRPWWPSVAPAAINCVVLRAAASDSAITRRKKLCSTKCSIKCRAVAVLSVATLLLLESLWLTEQHVDLLPTINVAAIVTGGRGLFVTQRSALTYMSVVSCVSASVHGIESV